MNFPKGKKALQGIAGRMGLKNDITGKEFLEEAKKRGGSGEGFRVKTEDGKWAYLCGCDETPDCKWCKGTGWLSEPEDTLKYKSEK